MRAHAAVLFGALMLSGCVSVRAVPTTVNFAPSCGAGLSETRIADLYFGRNIGGTFGVDDAEWQAFVNREITPRFPDGLSITDVSGQWRGPSGEIVREPSKAVMVILSGDPGEREKLDAIRAAYVEAFDQDAVMLIQRSACVGF